MNCRQAESENLYCDDQWPFLDSNYGILQQRQGTKACWTCHFFPEVYKSDLSYVFQATLKWGFAHYKGLDGWTSATFSHAKQRHVKVEDGEIEVARWHFPDPVWK